MIILDTNVVSALMRKTPVDAVERWLNRQPRPSVWTTTITLLEVRFGIELLPAGRRRQELSSALADILSDALGGRVLDFGIADAETAAGLMARGRASGRAMEFRDAMIAAMAVTRRAQLATCNIRHFATVGLDLVDPSEG